METAHEYLTFLGYGWDLMIIRNCVAAPVAEEVVFRGHMMPLLLAGGFSAYGAMWLAPVFFGLAHLHHAVQAVLVEGVPVGRALAQSAFQFAFTTIFGWYSAFLFIRTGTVSAPIVAHAFCNLIGFPPFGALGRISKRNVTIGAILGGMVAFFILLFPMTSF